MTILEAKKIALICSAADGGCSVCVRNLYEELCVAFPEIPWSFSKEGHYGGKPTSIQITGEPTILVPPYTWE